MFVLCGGERGLAAWDHLLAKRFQRSAREKKKEKKKGAAGLRKAGRGEAESAPAE
jgi:hypothetical protein